MIDVTRTMAPNQTGNNMAGAFAGGGMIGPHGLSGQGFSEYMAKILAKLNETVANKAEAAQGADDKQENVAMVELQQAVALLSTAQTSCTTAMTSLNDAQKETARASK
jgi:delta 1-pyrroline-5-carboxylate dehydrogenase